MSAYKGFTLNDPGGAPIWAAAEKTVFQNIIDTLVLDACVQTKSTTLGHQHYRLYYSGGTTAAATVDASGNIGIGVAAASAITEIRGATEQLRLSFDGTDRLSLTVDTSGNTTITPSGDRIWMAAGKDLGLGGTVGAPTAKISYTDADLQFIVTTGYVRFGTYAGLSGETVAGYITIKDIAGNLRKIAVVA